MTGDGDCRLGGAAKRLNLGLIPQILDRFLPFDVQVSAEGSVLGRIMRCWRGVTKEISRRRCSVNFRTLHALSSTSTLVDSRQISEQKWHENLRNTTQSVNWHLSVRSNSQVRQLSIKIDWSSPDGSTASTISPTGPILLSLGRKRIRVFTKQYTPSQPILDDQRCIENLGN
jgi:hypothetical protein